MIGFNLVLPTTNVFKIRVENDRERQEVVAKLCEQWQDYCITHWMSENHEEPYCAENRVKRFLDGMGYFLLRSDTSNIISEYMDEMNKNREIPVSSCPDYINDMFYANGQGDVTQAQKEAMQSLNSYLDERARPAKSKKKKETSYTLRRNKRKAFEAKYHPFEYQYPVVDTEGNFTVISNGTEIHLKISGCKQYEPKMLKDDVLYDMDHIIVANVKEDRFYFFDQNFDPVDEFVVKN